MEIENKVREIVCQQLDVEPGERKPGGRQLGQPVGPERAAHEVAGPLDEMMEIDGQRRIVEEVRVPVGPAAAQAVASPLGVRMS